MLSSVSTQISPIDNAVGAADCLNTWFFVAPSSKDKSTVAAFPFVRLNVLASPLTAFAKVIALRIVEVESLSTLDSPT